jgi:hypothetical protein
MLPCAMTEELDDDALEAWRAFLTAHALVTRQISRDLVAEGLPDLGWYDLLWALRRSPASGCVSTSSRARSCSPPPR